MNLPIGSYTFYNTLQNCPHQAYHRYVGKTLPFVSTPEMEWGNAVHTAFEHRIRSGATLPDSMRAGEQLAKQFHDMSKVVAVRVELQLAMTIDGKPCDYKDYGRVWFRGKLDCVVFNAPRPEDADTAWVDDWKTGNVREDPFELECGALLLKVNYQMLIHILAEYFWLKTGQAGLRYTLNNHGATYEKLVNLRREAETYLEKGEWPKRKSPLCGYCQVKSCEHNTLDKRLAKEGKI